MASSYQIIVRDDLIECTKTLEKTIDFCEELGIVNRRRVCVCGNMMRVEKRKCSDGCRLKCHKKDCKKTKSIRVGGWFEGSHLSLRKLLWIAYDWCHEQTNDYAKTNNGRNSCQLSDHTIVDWFQFCRDVCANAILTVSEKIGGPGKIVEIDESKFGRRKYNKGRRDGVWVFRGVEHGSNKLFLLTVPDRTKETLTHTITTWIEPGSTIYSDCWRAYDTNLLLSLGYQHQKVNHSKYFKDPITGVHTNTIEGAWHHAK